MKFYRLQDEYASSVNDMLKGNVESVNVVVQGFKGNVTLTKDNVINKLGEIKLDKPCFYVVGEQKLENVSYSYKNEKGENKSDFSCIDSDKMNALMLGESVECKYKGTNCVYNLHDRQVIITFEGIIYNFEKISIDKEENK